MQHPAASSPVFKTELFFSQITEVSQQLVALKCIVCKEHGILEVRRVLSRSGSQVWCQGSGNCHRQEVLVSLHRPASPCIFQQRSAFLEDRVRVRAYTLSPDGSLVLVEMCA